jgi:hypothetical protein
LRRPSRHLTLQRAYPAVEQLQDRYTHNVPIVGARRIEGFDSARSPPALSSPAAPNLSSAYWADAL